MPRRQSGCRKGRPTTANRLPPGTWEPGLRLWINVRGHGSLGPGKMRLLRTIADTRSLVAAARKLRMSYRLAWEHLRLIEQRAGMKVVIPRRGGRSGGGTDLTTDGKALMEAYQAFCRDVDEYVQAAFRRHFSGRSSFRSRKA